MNRLSRYLLFFLFPAVAHSHEDTTLHVQGSQIVGLPEQYQPAVFDPSTRTFAIAGTKVLFPECYGNFFPLSADYQIAIHSSWYHDLEMLPPYIAVHLTEGGEERRHFFLMHPLRPFCDNANEAFCRALKVEVVDDQCLKQFQYEENLSVPQGTNGTN